MTENIVQAIRPTIAPRNIQGDVFPVCLHCAGLYFAQNKFLFIDQKATIDAQKRHGTLPKVTESEFEASEYRINQHED
eukprot:12926381-Prorocentrum_lima.AAC.1